VSLKIDGDGQLKSPIYGTSQEEVEDYAKLPAQSSSESFYNHRQVISTAYHLHKVEDSDVVWCDHLQAFLVQQCAQDGCMIGFYRGYACQQLQILLVGDAWDRTMECCDSYIFKQEGPCSIQMLPSRNIWIHTTSVSTAACASPSFPRATMSPAMRASRSHQIVP